MGFELDRYRSLLIIPGSVVESCGDNRQRAILFLSQEGPTQRNRQDSIAFQLIGESESQLRASQFAIGQDHD